MTTATAPATLAIWHAQINGVVESTARLCVHRFHRPDAHDEPPIWLGYEAQLNIAGHGGRPEGWDKWDPRACDFDEMYGTLLVVLSVEVRDARAQAELEALFRRTFRLEMVRYYVEMLEREGVVQLSDDQRQTMIAQLATRTMRAAQ
jgi:hypothetical protein